MRQSWHIQLWPMPVRSRPMYACHCDGLCVYAIRAITVPVPSCSSSLCACGYTGTYKHTRTSMYNKLTQVSIHTSTRKRAWAPGHIRIYACLYACLCPLPCELLGSLLPRVRAATQRLELYSYGLSSNDLCRYDICSCAYIAMTYIAVAYISYGLQSYG